MIYDATKLEKEQVSSSSPLLLSLFCGPGGFDEGFWQAGYQTVLAADINRASITTHRRNHEGRGCISKVLDLAATDASDLIRLWRARTDRMPSGIIGGPPCQSFSRSNCSKKEDDPRNELLYHYARLVSGMNAEFGLDFFVFENVPELNKFSHKDHYIRFKENCEDAGFHVNDQLLDTADFGVPQHRVRLFIVGINKRHLPDAIFKWPLGTHMKVKAKDVLDGLPDPAQFRRKLKVDDIPYHPNHWCMKPRSKRFQDGTLVAGECKGRSLRVLDWEKPSWTVAYGHREVHVHPNCQRRLSVYEAMLLQGFPKEYQLLGTLSEQITQVSEAVSPPIAEAIAKAITACVGYLPHTRAKNGNQPPSAQSV